jgi:peptidoglycan/xylan/chitin deacetylase (PgdA/CDA1 family)
MRAILTFHSIDSKGSVISYTPALFGRLLDTLDRKQIPVYGLDTLMDPQTGKGVALTFDDGMRSVYQAALPVLREYGVPAHVFVTTGVIEQGHPWPRQPASIPSFDMLDWQQLEALQAAGVAIESHTHTHPDMRTLSDQQMEEECAAADDIIERRLGRRPQYFAYPFGYHNSLARAVAARRYRGAVTTELRSLGFQEDSAALPRLDSYYFQTEKRIRGLDSTATRVYLGVRSLLRTLRGSQCTPGCD